MSAIVHHGDCRDVMLAMAARGELFDAVVCDPPYDLVSIVKRFGGANAAPAKSNGPTGVYGRASRGFMGKQWDGTGVAFDPATWALAYDVLKPGAHLLAFGGTRTWHRMAVAIEDAGFEIRDCVMWLYGTGFPKSLDVSKAIDKAAGAERTEVVGSKLGRPGMAKDGSNQRSGFDHAFGGEKSGLLATDITAPATDAARQWQGWETALKPGWEPCIVARKPLAGTVAENVQAHGTGALNIDACRVPTADNLNGGAYSAGGRAALPGDERSVVAAGMFGEGGGRLPGEYEQPAGRWPANILHDGSDEVMDAFAAFDQSGDKARIGNRAGKASGCFDAMARQAEARKGISDTGTAARFFYSAKAGARDRAGSKHPTVKPLALLRYLCRLVCPPGGVILDPFAGSGTTLQAAVEEGFRAVGIEQDPEYVADIQRRLALREEAPAAHRGEDFAPLSAQYDMFTGATA